VVMAIPNSRHWISPLNTGSAEHIPANNEQMSVPPKTLYSGCDQVSEGALITRNGSQQDLFLDVLVNIVKQGGR